MNNVLKLQGALIDELPRNYKFEGTIDLTKSDVKSLPKNLFVREDLIIQDCLVDSIPEGTIIGGNLIINGPELLPIHPTALICGDIIYNGNIMPNRVSENDQFIYLADGGKFFYEKRTFYPHTSSDQRHNRVPFYFYKNYSNKGPHAVTFHTEAGRFAELCKSVSDAKFHVNYQMARENGIERYRGLDIEKPRSGKELLEIYATCVTFACDRGVNEFLKMFNLTLESTTTILDIGFKVQEFKFFKYAPGVEVFLDFFNIPILSQYKKETE